MEDCKNKTMDSTSDGNPCTCEIKAEFMYIWTIENASDLNFEKLLISPAFTVKSMEMTRWCFGFKICGKNIHFHVYRKQDGDGPEQIKINYEFSFLDQNGVPLITKADAKIFIRSGHSEFPEFIERDEIFSRRKAEFLQKDVLTIRCRMWRNVIETPSHIVCYASTHFGLDRHRFVWTINDFSTLPSGYKATRVLKSTSEESPDHSLIFYLAENCNNGEVYACVDFDIGAMGINNTVKGEIALLNADGTVVNRKNIIKFIEKRYIILCAFFFSKQKLLIDKTILLPNDMLSIRCEFEICYGPLWSRIENCAESETSAQRVNKTDGKESIESVISSCPFKENVHTFYEDATLSDVSLRAGSETFPAHKVILSSRSPVFKAMFTNDMREKDSKCIEMPDVGAPTLRHLLSYIYTNKMPEVEWDDAVDLFRVADKYELLELKKQCSAILKSNISRTNICIFLSLADMHNDGELYKGVLSFVSRNLDIFKSEMWKTFKKENSELAMEAMERIIYFKNSN